MENASTFMFVVAVAFGIGILLYFLTLSLAFIFNVESLKGFKKIVQSNLAFNVGILTSGLASFGIVAVFWSAFSNEKVQGKSLTLEFMGLQFSGPSGPITLWVLCFLSIVLAMYLLKDKKL